MGITICPNAADWGSVAEFLNVGVAGFVGWAVWLLSKRTFDLQHSVEADRRALATAQRDMLLLYLYAELVRVRGAMRNVLQFLDSFVSENPSDDGIWRDFMQYLGAVKMPVTRGLHDRIHLLRNPTAGSLVRMSGYIEMLQALLEGGEATKDPAKFTADIRASLTFFLEELATIDREVAAARDRAGMRVISRAPAESEFPQATR